MITGSCTPPAARLPLAGFTEHSRQPQAANQIRRQFHDMGLTESDRAASEACKRCYTVYYCTQISSPGSCCCTCWALPFFQALQQLFSGAAWDRASAAATWQWSCMLPLRAGVVRLVLACQCILAAAAGSLSWSLWGFLGAAPFSCLGYSADAPHSCLGDSADAMESSSAKARCATAGSRGGPLLCLLPGPQGRCSGPEWCRFGALPADRGLAAAGLPCRTC